METSPPLHHCVVAIQMGVGWLVGCILWHIYVCRLFNAKFILYK